MTKNLFFFGTLRHIPLLEVVLGRGAEHLDISAASLPGYRVSAVAEGPFPTIEAEEGAMSEGLLVAGLSADDIARLDFYEGSFAYDLQALTLSDGREAEVYLPQPGRWTPAGPWSLDDWIVAHGEMSVIAATEVMSYRGTRSRDEVAAMFPVIRVRAASAVRAQRSRHGKDTYHGRIDIKDRVRRYSKFFALDDISLSHARFDGAMSPVLERAVFVVTDAALVLPYDPVRDCVLVIEQMRLGPIGRGDRTCWQVEPIAGRIDAGETPQEAARREAHEEAGLELGTLEPIGEMYPTPGNSTEFYYLYLGLADLPQTAQGTGGLASEHEDIRSHIWSFDTLMSRVAALDVANAPLVTCAYYLSHHRDRLRSEGAGGTPRTT